MMQNRKRIEPRRPIYDAEQKEDGAKETYL